LAFAKDIRQIKSKNQRTFCMHYIYCAFERPKVS